MPPLFYLSVLILATWLLYYSMISSFFTVREVDVYGDRQLDSEQLRDATASLGRNILSLRTADIEQSLRTINAVRRANVQLQLSGRVAIDVVERTPAVAWQSRNGSFLVDGDGVVFSREASAGSVPVLRQMDGSDVELGGRIEPSVIGLVQTLDVELPARAGIHAPWYEYSAGNRITVPVPDGPRIVFGDVTNLEWKLATLVAIRAQLEAAKARAEIIDLRFKDRPVYVLPNPAPAKPGPVRP